jgi:thiol-disulfide isomerase/thioredoxin
MKISGFMAFTFLLVFMPTAALFAQTQAETKPPRELHLEVESYLVNKSRELASQGKRLDVEKRDELVRDKKLLAEKYAAEVSLRADLKETDFYYLALLYLAAEENLKTIESMKKFIAQYPPDAQGDLLQSARSYVVIFSTRRRQMAEAERFYGLWLKGTPVVKTQQPMLEQILAVGFFKDGQYGQAIKYGQNAFDLLKTSETGTFREKREKEQIYMNLVEVLALSYQKDKNSEKALNILAEARARSFTLPSASLYRKVMNFVAGSGFTEKNLIERLESYAAAEPAPELKIVEWIGQEPATLKSLRGKIVLLDFWATWCVPCIATFPRLRDWHKKYGGDDFVILGVTKYYGRADAKPLTPLQEFDFLGEFKQKHKLPYDIVIADQGEDSMKYGIAAYPTTVLLDRNGVVRYIGIGSGVEESENLEEMIKKLLREETRLASSQK